MGMCVIAFAVLAVIAVIVSIYREHHAEEVNSDAESEDRDKAIADEEMALRSLLERDLDPIACDVPMKRGEQCYFLAPAALFESRKVRNGIAFAGPTISLPLVKSMGLRFRAGYLSHAATASDELAELDNGFLVATNKEILVVGEKLSRAIELKDIIRTGIAKSDLPNIPFLVSITKRKGKVQYLATTRPSGLLAVLCHFTNSCSELFSANS